MAMPVLTDGVILLRPLQLQDTEAHLAGEDEEIAKHLSGGRSTEDSVRTYIERSLQEWSDEGSRRAFGVFGAASDALIGSIEANLALPVLKAWQVNISYGVFKEWRGRGVAGRALRLMCEYLRRETGARQAIVRTEPDNPASARVAEKAGFRYEGLRDEGGSTMRWYVLDLE